MLAGLLSLIILSSARAFIPLLVHQSVSQSWLSGALQAELELQPHATALAACDVASFGPSAHVQVTAQQVRYPVRCAQLCHAEAISEA